MKIIESIVRVLKNGKLISIFRKYVEKYLAYRYLSKNPENIEFFNLFEQIKKQTDILLSYQEACLIYATAKKTEKINGEIAEVGVFKGGSAKLICGATKKKIHLFDTFAGLPDLDEKDDSKKFQKGNYSASFENVKSYLADCPNFNFYVGLFPSTADPIKDKTFSFVHLDVDIYESTLNSLEFFYPRMSKGGVIISHDYPSSKGVKKAFDDFFRNRSEIIIQPYATDQALVVKV